MKRLSSILLLPLIVVLVFSVSPIYNFADPEPFSGPDIFDPYSGLDSSVVWKRANFHTHTKVPGPLNECKYTPLEMLGDYRALGYDILTFSNHNLITRHPSDTALQVNVYEHGYGLFKFHKLVFGSERVKHFDHLLPLFASQKQWQLDYLADGSDFIQMNHPFRTLGTSRRHMSRLEGYSIMELDSGVTTEQEYWDWALSAGHYSYGLANDDCHDSRTSNKVAVRCNWLDVESGRYADIKDCLLSGRYYSMRVPDFGQGDWNMKYEGNRNLPQIRAIGARKDSLYLLLSRPADSIKVWGMDHSVLASAENAGAMDYVMKDSDPYARFTAYFADGTVIYSNVFARYDKTKAPSPFRETGHSLNIFLTLLFNGIIAALIALCIFLLCKAFSHKENKA